MPVHRDLDRLAEALEMVGVGVWEWDVVADSVYWSPEVLPLFGLDPADFGGTYEEVAATIHPDDLDAWRAAVERSVRTAADHDLEVRVVHPDGAVRWIHAPGRVETDAQGRAVRLIGVVHDITDRKDQETHALGLARQLADAETLAGVGSWIRDVRTGRATWSDGLFRLYGREPALGEPAPDELYDVIHPDDRDEVAASLEESLRTGHHDMTYRIVRYSDGEPRWVTSRARVHFDGEGRPSRRVGVNIDITARRLAEQRLEDRSRQLADAERVAGVGTWVVDMVNGVTEWSRGVFDVYGRDPADGQPAADELLEIVEPADRDLIRNAVAESVETGELDVEYRVRRYGDGELRRVAAHGRVTFRDGVPIRRVGALVDVTERRRAEERLRMAAEVFRSTTEAIFRTDRDGLIVEVNDAFTEATGYREEDVVGESTDMLRSRFHNADLYERTWAELLDSGNWRGEVWFRRRDGSNYPTLLTLSAVTGDDGDPSGYIGISTDITELKASEGKLEHLANHDELTGLPNRRLLAVHLTRAMLRARRHGGHVAVVFVDLDDFKSVNDSMSHAVGDELLRQVADRLTAVVRGPDTVARMSGDEFIVVLEELARPVDAATVVTKILDGIAEPFVISGSEIRVTASLGLSFFPDDGDDVASLLRNADAAMYNAKSLGRATWAFYSPEMTESASAQLALSSDLRRGFEAGEFRLVYQPQLELQTGRWVGVEALLRWRSPARGDVSPAEFIPIAERSSLIRELGEWVLDEACAQKAVWNAAGVDVGRVAVNVAGAQLRRGDLGEVVARTLQRHGLEPRALGLEVTEDFAVDAAGDGVAALRRLAKRGVQVAVDDFGTGYSSLGRLKRLPIHRVKIDRSFVGGVADDPHDEAIVAAVLALAAALGIEPVAEGIETAAQRDALIALGCRYAQGFVLSEPLEAAEVPVALAASLTDRPAN